MTDKPTCPCLLKKKVSEIKENIEHEKKTHNANNIEHCSCTDIIVRVIAIVLIVVLLYRFMHMFS
jgi:hypothetical protein